LLGTCVWDKVSTVLGHVTQVDEAQMFFKFFIN
jgi:hypothetical protein